MASSVPCWPPGPPGGPGRDHPGVPRPVAGVSPWGPRLGRAAGPARDPHPRGLRRPPRAPRPRTLRRRRRGLSPRGPRRQWGARRVPPTGDRPPHRETSARGKAGSQHPGRLLGRCQRPRCPGGADPSRRATPPRGRRRAPDPPAGGPQPGRAVPAGHLGSTRDPQRQDPRRAVARPDPATGPGDRAHPSARGRGGRRCRRTGGGVGARPPPPPRGVCRWPVGRGRR